MVLLGLLILLGSLQYVWLSEIGENQRENMQNRLNRDVRDFASAFNSEIRWAYYSFQIDPTDWLKRDWTVFNQRYDGWKKQANFPDLVQDIYFVGKDSAPLRYNPALHAFEETEPTDELQNIKNLLEKNRDSTAVDAFVVDTYLLVSPNLASGKEVSVDEKGVPHLKFDLSGYVVIKLNRQSVENLLAELTRKFFPEVEFANYAVAVFDNPDLKTIFANKDFLPVEWEKNDANIALLNLANSPFYLTVNSNVFSSNKKNEAERPKIIPPVKVAPPPPLKNNPNDSAKVIRYDEQNKQTKEISAPGNWMLSVRHIDGSLDKFAENTRRKNLAISFGILGILGASLLLIYVSVRRAQTLAQKQMDFVSAVSHEFRTPLAILLSAGENLSDGVIRDRAKIADYGNLIKREGKKLSGMVEQILEFAGAKSGKKNYRFAETEVGEIVENALGSCQSLIEENNFTIEKNFSENLPKITADKSALSRALQNLIVNSIKYDKGEKIIRISARNGDSTIKIAVEDRGIGISAKDLAQIFNPFYRAKSVVDSQISGNGLGLSILKQTVEAHGGEILSESKIGEGSKFTIILPVER